MTRTRALAAAATLLLALPGATCVSQIPGTAANVEPILAVACNDAMLAANLAGLIPGVGAIVPYITAGCATAEGLAKLAADPTSTEWLGTLIGKIDALRSRFGVR